MKLKHHIVIALQNQDVHFVVMIPLLGKPHIMLEFHEKVHIGMGCGTLVSIVFHNLPSLCVDFEIMGRTLAIFLCKHNACFMIVTKYGTTLCKGWMRS